MATTTERKCKCGCGERWHRYPNTPLFDVRLANATCLSPDCPCRKFEPAGGDA